MSTSICQKTHDSSSYLGHLNKQSSGTIIYCTTYNFLGAEIQSQDK
jgi:hypothetical protein